MMNRFRLVLGAVFLWQGKMTLQPKSRQGTGRLFAEEGEIRSLYCFEANATK